MEKSVLSDQTGVVSVQFAIIFPAFISLFLMFFELCRLLFISSVLDLMVVEAGRFASHSEEPANYAEVFYDRLAEEIPAWALLTNHEQLNINVLFCNNLEEVINRNCSANSAAPLAVYSIQYQYFTLFSGQLFSVLNGVLNRSVVAYQEWE